MNKQIMIKHYEATPKETLIDILVASREEVEKLQNKNKECKREIERLNNIINELEKWLKEAQILYGINQQGFSWGVCGEALDKLQELKGGDKK